ncbi:DUF5050 domain-containing protein [Paenibacillus puerhi]|uniref:DUF5050 domain-containing protein n=1 Tax=Paenibacillus puerhi TaxID=2692622 RepID=UPI00135C3775|nr:DUF5050 domain-containing protein [Paenibacillus puerhi]
MFKNRSVFSRESLNKMKLLLGTLAISLSFSLHSPISRAASGDVQASFPVFPVTVNGTVMDVSHSEYPLLIYNDITYFPMTWNNMAALGLSVQWDDDSGLSIQKEDACVPLEQDLTPAVNSNEYSQRASLVPFPVTVNGRQFVNTNEPYPVLFYQDITYFPLTWKFAHDEFGWNTSWDSANGLTIESCSGVTNSQLKQAFDLNVANGGALAVEDDWIYMNPINQNANVYKLVKVRRDGSGEVKLSDDNAGSINVVGDWLYYTVTGKKMNGIYEEKMNGIYKIKTDGTQRTLVSSTNNGGQMWVQGDWIYYISQKFNIHKMKLDGSEDQELAAGSHISRFFLTSDRLYFIMQEKPEGPRWLYAINLDGTNMKKYHSEGNIANVIIVDRWLYYVYNDKHLKKMSLDGSVVIPLFTSRTYISSLQYREGWIYMINGTGGVSNSPDLAKLRIDGTGYKVLAEVRALALYFADKTLYFKVWDMGDVSLEHMEVK